ncbi:T9SS type A sorting domain-containing protein, partial [Bacteroidia bacterium]|nr:T9SS type A sorting domain-containing protein [Bacteroidia bacterium]
SDEFTLIIDVRYNYSTQTNSVTDLSLEDMLAVSPNPTSGKLNINVNLPENEEINIAVFNTVGQQVVLVENGTVSNSSYTVNLDNQANGMYYVKMTVNGNIITKKVMLNK